MICLLHGWLLEGSGSNLWTRSIVTAFARIGETVHLVCQENHPERYSAIAEAYRHAPSGEIETTLQRDTPYPGKCILHQPDIGDTLPVFVKDRYEEYDRVAPMVDLSGDELEFYIGRNVDAVLRIVKDHPISAIHANHVVLMPAVAQRVSRITGVPYAIMPHGSGIEYAVKKDERFRHYAASALVDSKRVFVIGDEMRIRVTTVFPEVPDLAAKFRELHLGVDSSQFQPVIRERRSGNIALLHTVLTGIPRGRTVEQAESLRLAVSGSLGKDELANIFADNGRYDGKTPDARVEQKLQSVNWNEDPVLLFTGRIISPKGIHSVIAALPLILEQVPDLRLIVVGHGPLREPMEALLEGLQTGDRELVRRIVRWGHLFEGSPEGQAASADLGELTRFFADLAARGEEDHYFDAAARLIRSDTVIFTGYLTHRELRFLFPCCDVGVFPSVVREAGPLVFLEALASGCFPLGTYFGGMAASIDAVSSELPEEAGAAMKLDLSNTVAGLVRQVPRALDLGTRYRDELARIAREKYDWLSVAGTLRDELRLIGSAR